METHSSSSIEDSRGSITMIVLLSLFIPISAFFFEIYPRLKNRLFGVDIWTHLLYLQEYHRQKGIPKKIENGFLIQGEYDYPPAFIFILSKFPLKLVKKYEFLFSPFFDSIHILLIFYISYFLTNNILLALVTQLLYSLTPIIVLENSSATPRSLGYLLFTIVFMLMFLFNNTHVYIYLFSAIAFGTCIFLAHRFTAQGFLFFSIVFTLLERNVLFFGVFFISFFFAVVLSKGFYIKVLRGHIGNLQFWYQNSNYRFAHQVKGNYKTYKTQDFVFTVYNQFLKFPPFVLAITNPWVLTAFSSAYFFPVNKYIEREFLYWIGISYVISLLTIWIPKLRFLGEGQRYLELSAFPAAFLSAEVFLYLLHTQFSFIGVIVFITIALASIATVITIQRKAIIKDTLRTITPSMQAMFDYLKAVQPKPRLLCIPHQITTNVIYHTGCSVFVNADYAHIYKISEIYPFLKKPLDHMMRTYKLDMILLNEDYAHITDLHLKKHKEIMRFNNFVLLKVL